MSETAEYCFVCFGKQHQQQLPQSPENVSIGVKSNGVYFTAAYLPAYVWP